jgi:hypothetical protein
MRGQTRTFHLLKQYIASTVGLFFPRVFSDHRYSLSQPQTQPISHNPVEGAFISLFTLYFIPGAPHHTAEKRNSTALQPYIANKPPTLLDLAYDSELFFYYLGLSFNPRMAKSTLTASLVSLEVNSSSTFTLILNISIYR